MRLCYGMQDSFYHFKPVWWGGQATGAKASGYVTYGSDRQKVPADVYGPSLERDFVLGRNVVMLFDTRGNPDETTPYGNCNLGGFWNFGAQGMIGHPNFSGCYAFLDCSARRMTWDEMFGQPFEPSLGTNWWTRIDNNLMAAGRTSSYRVDGFVDWCGWD